jgi:hypothetical protein
MKESSRTANDKDKANAFGRVVLYTLANGTKTKGKVTASSRMSVALSIQARGRVIKSMVKGCMSMSNISGRTRGNTHATKGTGKEGLCG